MRIKEKAKEIEELALRKEQLLNAKSSADGYGQSGGMKQSVTLTPKRRDERAIDETLEVNEMLVDAIKAKLAILDSINA